MVEIFYDNKNAFSDVGPTPFVSMSQDFIDYGSNWNQVTRITLQGQIIGEYLGSYSFESLNKSVDNLHSAFSKNFSNLQIKEDGLVIFSAQSVIIESINIDSANWYGLLSYSIDLLVYEPSLYSNYFGVVDPSDEISYQDEDGEFLSYTRKISAKGLVVNGKTAIQNAKEWVLSRKAINPNIKTSLVRDNNNNNFLVQSENEVIDRFNGAYSIEIVYRKNISTFSPPNAFLTYAVDISFQEEEGLISATINGSLTGNTMPILFSEYEKLDLYFICNSVVAELFSENLSKRIISINASENANTNSLEFSATFNNDYSDDIIEDTSVEYKLDTLTCITTVSITTNISCKYGDLKARWLKVKDYFENTFSPFAAANEVYEEESSASKKLFSTPISESISYKEYDATISYSATYDDKKKSFAPQIAAMSSSASYTPSVNLYGTNTSATKTREHNIQNLNTAKRASVQISVSATGKPNATIQEVLGPVNTEMQRLFSNYVKGGDPILEDRNVEIKENPSFISRSETWSFEGEIIS
jgi:hypothetical protein